MPGYKPEILENKKDFKENLLCCICQLLLRAAVQSFCGHRFCESCVKERFVSEASSKDGSQVRCPVCPGDWKDGVLKKDKIYPDFHARKDLRPLKVTCQNEGCTWRGTFKKYVEHETLCDFAPIKCFKAGCGKSLRRGDLPYHLDKDCPMRNVKCRNCVENYTHKEMKRHNAMCPKAMVICDDCKTKLTRETLSRHQDYESGDCPKRKARCPYSTYGCNEQIGIHGNMFHHLQTHAVYHVDLLNYRYEQLCQRMEELLAANGRDSLGPGEEETTSVLQMAKKVDGMESKYDSLKRKRKYPYDGGPESQKNRLFDQMPHSEISESADANPTTSGTDMDGLTGSFENLRVTRKEDDVTCGKCQSLEKKVTEMKSVIDHQGTELKQVKTLYAVLDKRNETFQEVVAVLNNELMAFDGKLAALKRENRKLNDALERENRKVYDKLTQQETHIRAHDQMFTTINASLAAQEIRFLSLEKSVEAQNQAHATGSREPTLEGKFTYIWKIRKDTIKCEKQEAATATAGDGDEVAYIQTTVFHDRVGYNLRGRIYLHGNEHCDGKHVPMYLVVLKEDKGQVEMPWPFRRKVAILISSYKKKRQSWREVHSSVQHMRFPCDSDMLYLLPLAYLRCNQYVKEGFLCMRIDVEDVDEDQH